MHRDPLATFRPGVLLFERFRLGSESGSGALYHDFFAEDEALGGLAVRVRVPTADALRHGGLDRAILVAARRWADAPPAAVLAPVTRGLVDDIPCVVTPVPAGPTLHEVLQRQPPATSEARLALLRGVARALDALHAAGFVHRALSPVTVRLDARGGVVLDDGVFPEAHAAVVGERAAAATALYRAPETLAVHPDGPAFDAASDRHAFACLALETLVGRPVARVTGTDPADATLPPEALASLDDPLRDAFLTGLQPDPTQRPASAVAFLDTLDAALAISAPAQASSVATPVGHDARPGVARDREFLEVPPRAEATQRAPRRGLGVALSLVLLLVGLALGLALSQRVRAPTNTATRAPAVSRPGPARYTRPAGLPAEGRMDRGVRQERRSAACAPKVRVIRVLRPACRGC